MRAIYWVLLGCIFLANLWAAYRWGHYTANLSFSLIFLINILPYALGATFAVLAMALITWFFVKLAGRRHGYKPNLLAYCAIGGVIFTLLALSGEYTRYESERRNIALTYEYSPEHCGFSVRFPGVPLEKPCFAPGIIFCRQADFSTKYAHLRMECVDWVYYDQPKEQIREGLEIYAAANGFIDVTFESAEDSTGALWEMRACKIFDSQRVMVKLKAFYAKGSLMNLSVFTLSKDYPHPIESKFFGSVRIKAP